VADFLSRPSGAALNSVGQGRHPQRRPGPYRERMASPRARPPLVLRIFVALLGVVALLFNAMLMLSDRAPSALQRIGGSAVRRLFERIDLGGRGADVLNDPRLPESDAIVHVAVWALAAVLVGWALWTWIGLAVGASAVFAGSLVIEALQGSLSTTRQVESSDVKANLAGVVIGTTVAAACYLAYSALAAMFRRRPDGWSRVSAGGP
jgi:hypothetical protein